MPLILMKSIPSSSRCMQYLIVFVLVFLQSCVACRTGLGEPEQHDLAGSSDNNLYSYSIEFPQGFRVEHDGDRPPKGKGEMTRASAAITNTNIGDAVEVHSVRLRGLRNSTKNKGFEDGKLVVDDKDFVQFSPNTKPTVFAKPGNFLRVNITGREDDNLGCDEAGNFSFVVRLPEDIPAYSDEESDDPQVCTLGENAAIITITPGVNGSAIDSDPENWVAYHETSRVVTNKGTVLAPLTAKVCALPVR